METVIHRIYPSAVNMGLAFNGSSLTMPCGVVTDIRRLSLTVLVNDSVVMRIRDVMPRTLISFINVVRVHAVKSGGGEVSLFIERFY